MFIKDINPINRQAWLKGVLGGLPAGMRLLDAGAGQLQNRQHCVHLDYISQDFCQYTGTGGKRSAEGLHTNGWDTTRIDLVSDITDMPVPDASFDAILCSEVLEHVPEPTHALDEFARLLKPGGTLLVLTPDWEANYKTFFDDFTHVRPMSRRSMNLLLSMLDPKKLDIYRFRQLPITWKSPIVNAFCAVISPFIPVNTRKPFFRWSRELMLIGVAVKK